MDSLTLGQRLRLVRNKRGLTQKKVADMLGIRPPSLCAYEKDQSEPNVETLKWYARYFMVSADWLLGLEEDSRVESSSVAYRKRALTDNNEQPLTDDELRILRQLISNTQPHAKFISS